MVYQLDSGNDGCSVDLRTSAQVSCNFTALLLKQALADAMLLYDQLLEEERQVVGENASLRFEYMSAFSAEVGSGCLLAKYVALFTSAPRRFTGAYRMG
jgi:hypothetical protein